MPVTLGSTKQTALSILRGGGGAVLVTLLWSGASLAQRPLDVIDFSSVTARGRFDLVGSVGPRLGMVSPHEYLRNTIAESPSAAVGAVLQLRMNYIGDAEPFLGLSSGAVVGWMNTREGSSLVELRPLTLHVRFYEGAGGNTELVEDPDGRKRVIGPRAGFFAEGVAGMTLFVASRDYSNSSTKNSYTRSLLFPQPRVGLAGGWRSKLIELSAGLDYSATARGFFIMQLGVSVGFAFSSLWETAAPSGEVAPPPDRYRLVPKPVNEAPSDRYRLAPTPVEEAPPGPPAPQTPSYTPRRG